ncbi:MAG: GntR family transcriptional regulator [Acetivibrionales bacterium]
MITKKKESLSSIAYETIKDMIITNQFEPGELITETQIQSILNIGRTPIREAFLKLSYENLVTIIPRKGIEVCRISPQIVNAIFVARKIIEPTVLRQSIQNLDKDWLKDMRSKFMKVHDDNLMKEKDGIIEYHRTDLSFHYTLVGTLGNKYLSDLVNNYMSHLMMICIATTQKSSRAGVANLEHISIIDYILKNDTENACNALTEHIVLSHKEVIDNYINS